MYLMRIGATGSGGMARVAPIVSERAFQLEPGDLVDTGTPAGVGMGHTPPVWLRPGDVMELGVTGLGSQRQRVLGPR